MRNISNPFSASTLIQWRVIFGYNYINIIIGFILFDLNIWDYNAHLYMYFNYMKQKKNRNIEEFILIFRPINKYLYAKHL